MRTKLFTSFDGLLFKTLGGYGACMSKFQFFFVGLFAAATAFSQQYIDTPYLQDYADKFELSSEENELTLKQVRSDRNKNINILSADGLLQPWEKALVRDQRYRPLTDQHIIAFDTYMDQFVYLTDEALLSNAWAGKFYIAHHVDKPTHFVMGENFSFLLAAKGKLAYFKDNKSVWKKSLEDFVPVELLFDTDKQTFIVLSENAIYTIADADQNLLKRFSGNNLTAISLAAENSRIVVGTEDGILSLDSEAFEEIAPINKKLPDTDISCINEISGRLWFGSAKGAFSQRPDGKYDYYASKRWLVDDKVSDIFSGPDNSVLILTEKGLSKINFVEMTLAEKAEYFQMVQRQRHIRQGFSSEGHLSRHGDPSSIVLGDTDNDGLWTSMYLAGELFRYAATLSEDALQNAYEAFEAMERLTEISGIKGFPARTYEIDGYQSSDNDLEESAWWLREFPMDLVSWRVDNSQRQDLTRVEPNFRRQEYTVVLPRDERPMHLHNNAYRNNGGSNGSREYPPYIYLLPHWAGRYVEAISEPVN